MALIKKEDKDQKGKKPFTTEEPAVKKKEQPVKKIAVKTEKKQEVAKKSVLSRFDGIKKYFRGVYGELKKVHWPTRREVLTYTAVVVVAVVIVATLIWIFDSVMSKALQFIIQ